MNILTLDGFLTVVASLLCSVVIFIIQYRLFLEPSPSRRPDSPASFFALPDLISKRSRRTLGFMCALPTACLFFVLAIHGEAFVKAAQMALSNQVVQTLPEGVQSGAREALKAIPPWLKPASVFILALVVFLPFVRTPILWFRDAIYFALGLTSRADEISRAAAREVIQHHGTFDKTQVVLSANFNARPTLPKELAGASDENKLAFELLSLSSDETRKSGIDSALAKTASRLNVKLVSQAILPPPSYIYISAALTFYLVLCIAYVIFTPALAPWIKSNATALAFLQPIAWPEPGYRFDLATTLANRTLSFVLPLALGMYLYSSRRKFYESNEKRLLSYLVVVHIQLLISVITNTAFWVLSTLQIFVGEMDKFSIKSSIAWSDFKTWVDIFTFSLAPGVALGAWVACRELGRSNWIGAFTVCLTSGVTFYVCQLAYEFVGERQGIYWHQMVLGAFLTIVYFVAAAVATGIAPVGSDGNQRSGSSRRLVRRST